MPSAEHRRHPRFHVLSTTARSGRLEARVLNLSRSGMLLESASGLEVGRQLRFEVSDRQHDLEVEAEVRWSREHGDHPTDIARIHRSGVQFSRILSRQARGVWARLVANGGQSAPPVDRRPVRGPEADEELPLLSIVWPLDGAVVPDDFVTVFGEIRDRSLGAAIEVNGVRASLTGRRFEARVTLTPGINELTAAIVTTGSLVCRSPSIKVYAAPPSPDDD